MAGKVRREHNGTIRKLPSGRYQVRLRIPGSLPPEYYPHPDGTFATKAPARKALDKHNTAIDEGTWKHPDEVRAEAEAEAERAKLEAVTVAELSEEWLDLKRAEGLSQGSLVTYRSRLDAGVLPAFGDTRVVDVTVEQVEAWVKSLTEQSPSRAEFAYGTLSAVMKHAVERSLIASSPCQLPAKLRTAPRSAKRDRGIVVPDDVMRRIADEVPPPFGLVPLLAGWCALREGEALALSSSALVEVNGTMFVEVRVQDAPKGPRGLVAPKSAAGVRSVPAPAWLADMLRSRANEVDGLLFPSPRTPGLPLSRSAWDRRFAAAVDSARAAGVAVPDGVRLHDFRHSALTRLSRAGATAADLRLFGGHADDATAGIYQHSDAQRLAELMQRSED